MQDSLLSRYIRNPANLSDKITGDFPRIVSIDADGDEVAFFPPVTGG